MLYIFKILCALEPNKSCSNNLKPQNHLAALDVFLLHNNYCSHIPTGFFFIP